MHPVPLPSVETQRCGPATTRATGCGQQLCRALVGRRARGAGQDTMPKKGKGKKGKKGKKGAAAPKFNQQEFDRTMAPISAVAPTPLAADVEHPVVRINELVRLTYVSDPDGLVEHLGTLPVTDDGGGIDSKNEYGWTALMRSARDGLKKHVEALVNAGANVEITSTAEVVETHVDDDQAAKGAFKYPLGATTPAGRAVGETVTIVYPEGSTAADLCRQRHGVMAGKSTVSTEQNCQEILTMLENAVKTSDEEVLPGKLAEKLLLTRPPSYHNVPTTAGERGKPLVASGYYHEEDA
jgi:hypothetical protein